MGKPVLGTCQQFNVEHFENKSLMFFKGCPVPERGCTIKQLKIFKITLRQILLMMYNWKLEKSYIMDPFASLLVKRKQLNKTCLIND